MRTRALLAAVSLPFLTFLPALRAQSAPAPDARPTPPSWNLATAIGVSQDGDTVTGLGPDYTLRTTGDGITFVPMLGRKAPRSLPLTLRFVAARHGAAAVPTTPPTLGHGTHHIAFDHGTVQERYALRADGVEQTFTFAQRPAGDGDLVVRMAITSVVAGSARDDGGFAFLENGGGVTYGALTGVDARGEQCAGTVRLTGDQLELVLPDAFVDSALFPLTFDPLLGTAALAGGSADDSEPDIAYASNDRWCAVWRRIASLGESDLAGMFVDGSVVGQIPFVVGHQPGTDVANARIAFCPLRNCFVAAWQQATGVFGTSPTILARSLPADGSVFSNTLVAALGGGRIALGDAFANTQFLPLVQVQASGPVRSSTLTVTTPQSLGVSGSTHTLATATNPNADVAISRSGGSGSSPRHLVVWNGDIADAANLRAVVLGVLSAPYGSPVSLTTGASAHLHPAVDGDGTDFLVTWDESSAVFAQRCAVDAAATGITFVGTNLSLGAGVAGSHRNGDLVACGTRFFASWMRTSSLFDTVATASALTLDGQRFGPLLALVGPPRSGSYLRHGAPRLAAATAVDDDRVLAAFEEGQSLPPFDRDIALQMLEVIGSGGPRTNIAPGCGLGGTAGTNGPCAVGNTDFAFTLTGADPSAPLVLLSLALPTTTSFFCGPCTLLPPLVLETLTPVGGAAQRALPIPPDNTLVNAAFRAQWLPAFGQPGPCSTFGFLSASNLIQVDIGF